MTDPQTPATEAGRLMAEARFWLAVVLTGVLIGTVLSIVWPLR